MTDREPLHKTKRAVYVILLVLAILASGYAIYRQLSTEGDKQSLADQVKTACNIDPVSAKQKGLQCENEDVRDASPSETIIQQLPPVTIPVPSIQTIEVPQPPTVITQPGTVTPIPVPELVPGPTKTEVLPIPQPTGTTNTQTKTQTKTVTEDPPPPPPDPKPDPKPDPPTPPPVTETVTATPSAPSNRSSSVTPTSSQSSAERLLSELLYPLGE